MTSYMVYWMEERNDVIFGPSDGRVKWCGRYRWSIVWKSEMTSLVHQMEELSYVVVIVVVLLTD